jgi:hypothetical protein
MGALAKPTQAGLHIFAAISSERSRRSAAVAVY